MVISWCDDIHICKYVSSNEAIEDLKPDNKLTKHAEIASDEQKNGSMDPGVSPGVMIYPGGLWYICIMRFVVVMNF